MEVRKGQLVEFLCHSFLEDGTCLDDEKDSKPVLIRAGLAGKTSFSTYVAMALQGMKLRQTKNFRVPPHQVFGEVDPKKVFKLPLQDDRSMTIGDELSIKVTDGGRERIVEGVVVNIGADYADVDTNHPLAGQTILLRLKVLAIRKGK